MGTAFHERMGTGSFGSGKDFVNDRPHLTGLDQRPNHLMQFSRDCGFESHGTGA